MLKKLVLATTAFAFLGSAAALSVPAPAQAGMMDGLKDTMSCRKLAKEHYPDDRSMRKAFRKECKAGGGMM
ncbi:MAG: hypothetical protein ACPW61_04875 [Methyloligella sp. ZOD6]